MSIARNELGEETTSDYNEITTATTFEDFEKQSSCEIIRFILTYPWVTALHHVLT